MSPFFVCGSRGDRGAPKYFTTLEAKSQEENAGNFTQNAAARFVYFSSIDYCGRWVYNGINKGKGETKMVRCPNCGSSAQVRMTLIKYDREEYKCGCGCHFARKAFSDKLTKIFVENQKKC